MIRNKRKNRIICFDEYYYCWQQIVFTSENSEGKLKKSCPTNRAYTSNCNESIRNLSIQSLFFSLLQEPWDICATKCRYNRSYFDDGPHGSLPEFTAFDDRPATNMHTKSENFRGECDIRFQLSASIETGLCFSGDRVGSKNGPRRMPVPISKQSLELHHIQSVHRLRRHLW